MSRIRLPYLVLAATVSLSLTASPAAGGRDAPSGAAASSSAPASLALTQPMTASASAQSAAPAAKPVTVPTTAAPPAVAGKPAGDTGAPGTDGKAPITSDLSGMDREVFRSLPPEQRRKLVTEAFRRGGGGTGRDPLGLPDAWDPARAARNRTG